MLSLLLGNDGVELWRFEKEGSSKCSGIQPLSWEQDNIGWQVRDLHRRRLLSAMHNQIP